MCQYCKPLLKAIDGYIEKADKSLTGELKSEGYAEPKETVKHIETLEDGIESALVDETGYLVSEIEQSDTLDDVSGRWDKIKEGDDCAAKIAQVSSAEFTAMMPNLIQYYIRQTDRSLKLKQVTERTTAWVGQWSRSLGEIMQLNSHREIEKILVEGLEAGQGVAEFTRQILDSGIRDEYYKARRAAVTEVLRAHSVAQQEAFDQSPAVTGKRWKHTGEYRNEPRLNHADMDGQIVGVDDEFTLFGADGEIYHPMYPRDAVLPPGEAVNCHCICQPVVDESILGMSLEERQELQQQAIDEMDDEWERELNEQNKWRNVPEEDRSEESGENTRADNSGGLKNRLKQSIVKEWNKEKHPKGEIIMEFTTQEKRFLQSEFGYTEEKIDSLSDDELSDLAEKCFDIEVREAVAADGGDGEITKRGETAADIVTKLTA